MSKYKCGYDSSSVSNECKYKDIDLHRYKCINCSKVFYYSARAREFFQDGIECETYGLTTYNLLKYDGLIPKDYEKV